MRLRIDVGWLHVDVSLGPDEDDAEQRYTDLGSDTERADEHAHDRAEMDARREIGFRSHVTTRDTDGMTRGGGART